MKGVKSIPEKIRTQVLVKSNHRCCKCERDASEVDIHHIIPREAGGSNDPDNLIVLCPNCHRDAHRYKWKPNVLKLYKDRHVQKIMSERAEHKPSESLADFHNIGYRYYWLYTGYAIDRMFKGEIYKNLHLPQKALIQNNEVLRGLRYLNNLLDQLDWGDYIDTYTELEDFSLRSRNPYKNFFVESMRKSEGCSIIHPAKAKDILGTSYANRSKLMNKICSENPEIDGIITMRVDPPLCSDKFEEKVEFLRLGVLVLSIENIGESSVHNLSVLRRKIIVNPTEFFKLRPGTNNPFLDVESEIDERKLSIRFLKAGRIDINSIKDNIRKLLFNWQFCL